jgi:hypothetical protein
MYTTTLDFPPVDSLDFFLSFLFMFSVQRVFGVVSWQQTNRDHE